MLIVGLGHRRLTGKDTVARLLLEAYRQERPTLNVRRAAFADKLKDICHELYAHAGVQTREHYEEHPCEKATFLTDLDMTVRELWIKTGMAMRHVHEMTWVNFLARNQTADLLLIPDVRFPNEADTIKGAGGILVKVERDLAKKHTDEADTALVEFDDWDYRLPNNGCLTSLATRVLELKRFIDARLK